MTVGLRFLWNLGPPEIVNCKRKSCYYWLKSVELNGFITHHGRIPPAHIRWHNILKETSPLTAWMEKKQDFHVSRLQHTELLNFCAC